jgi:NADPH-dependent glutamate synthase beta subunit-like oxidoreductase
VIYAYGASEDRTLDIPGGNKTHPARKFVEWYNAHPYAESFDLSKVETVGIIGNGNVAIDIARIMGMNWESLEKTDINRETVEALKSSNVKEIYMIGRRGAIQAAMTVKELRLLTMVPEISIRVFQDEIERSLNDVSQEEADLKSPVAISLQSRARRRLFDLMNSLPRVHKSSAKTKLDFRFLLEPVSYENNTLKLEKTALSGTKCNQIAHRTGEFLSLSADLVFRSIGYKCIKIDSDLPFDESRGIVQNIAGRVPGSSPVYVTGWAKTGPFGVIDTTMRSVFVI